MTYMFHGCTIKQETVSKNKCNGRKDAKANLYAGVQFAEIVFSFYLMWFYRLLCLSHTSLSKTDDVYCVLFILPDMKRRYLK